MAVLIWSGKKRDLDVERIEFPEEYFLPPAAVSLFSFFKMAAMTSGRNDQWGSDGITDSTAHPIPKCWEMWFWKYSNFDAEDCVKVSSRIHAKS